MKKGGPECQSDIFCGVNSPKNEKELTDLEKKHTPVIECPDVVEKGKCFIVNVEVGKLMAHPNEPGHSIQFIELYSGDTYLGKMDFTAERTCPKASFCVSINHDHGDIRAFERCNLHGVWEARKAIKVK